eukprot:TRINITY_DN244_c0_g1_i1.p1 TRINITY_DN244_c0_g1~~TRINITY_DN244_c0_g1_i1.p1  ORF type:complete len:824 (+),score=206.29 TRINITY_DN244_c0_g1_i1:782-3253(+)
MWPSLRQRRVANTHTHRPCFNRLWLGWGGRDRDPIMAGSRPGSAPGSRRNTNPDMVREMDEFLSKLLEREKAGWVEDTDDNVLQEFGIKVDKHVAPTSRGIPRREDKTRVLNSKLDASMIEAVVAKALKQRSTARQHHRTPTPPDAHRILFANDDVDSQGDVLTVPSADCTATLFGRSKILEWVYEQEAAIRARQALYDLNPTHALRAPSFAVHLAKIWRCEIPGVPLQNENKLLVRYLKGAGREVPGRVLNAPLGADLAKAELLNYPVYSTYGRIEEADGVPMPNSPQHAKVLWSLRREVLVWKLDALLNDLRPPPPTAASTKEVKLKRSIERAVLVWQMKSGEADDTPLGDLVHAETWTFLAVTDTAAMEGKYKTYVENGCGVGMADRVYVITTLSDTYKVDFWAMVAHKGRRVLPIRRRWIAPTQMYNDAMFFWERVRMLCADITEAEDNVALYLNPASRDLMQSHLGTPLSALHSSCHSERSDLFSQGQLLSGADIAFMEDLRWLRRREDEERTSLLRYEIDGRFDLERACYEQGEEVARKAVEQRDAKVRLALWCMQQEHRKEMDVAKKQAAAEKSKITKLKEQKQLQAMVLSARHPDTAALAHTTAAPPASEYLKAGFTERYLLMLEAQRLGKEGAEREEGLARLQPEGAVKKGPRDQPSPMQLERDEPAEKPLWMARLALPRPRTGRRRQHNLSGTSGSAALTPTPPYAQEPRRAAPPRGASAPRGTGMLYATAPEILFSDYPSHAALPCGVCPSEASHRSNHWMWAGPPHTQPPPPAVTKLTHVAADWTGRLRPTFRQALPRCGTARSAIGADYE